MSKWMVAAKKADFEQIGKECGISPFLARIIRNRGILGAEETRRFLNGTPEELYDPNRLYGTEAAAEMIRKNIREKHRIRIIGDYDVDGISSTYILIRTLEFCGAIVSHRLPDRVLDGYGMNEQMVRELSMTESG